MWRFPFRVLLNASTLFPFHLTVTEQVQIAAKAGYQGVELWVKDIDTYLAAGGELSQLRDLIVEHGLVFANAIAFFPWADSDPLVREAGFQQAEREMRMLAALGCQAIAAAPFGNVAESSLDLIAESFARLDQLGRSIGIEPYLEFWGRAKQLSRLSQALYVAAQSGLPQVRLLLDPFHMYTGGSSLHALRYLRGNNIGIVHVNDYPAEPPRDQIEDRQRVFPGEGVGPTTELAMLLDQAGYNGFLSLELFIEDFGTASALEVAKRGLVAVQQAYRIP
ncbi:MAG: sugar phosphate isomerase/epimerase [Roseiflexaceae bacterium]